MTGEIIFGDDGNVYDLVDDDAYYTEEEIEAMLDQREYEREQQYEAYLDHLSNMVDAAERAKGRTLTDREMTSFVQDYVGSGLENGRGDVEAAAETLGSFSDLDDREGRRAYMAERMQEQPSEIHSSGGPQSEDAGEYEGDE